MCDVILLFQFPVISLWCAFPLCAIFCFRHERTLHVLVLRYAHLHAPATFKCSTAGMKGYKHLPTGAWPGQQNKQRLLQVRIPQQLGGTQMSHTSQNPPPCWWLAPTTTSRTQPTLPREREGPTLKQHSTRKERDPSVSSVLIRAASSIVTSDTLKMNAVKWDNGVVWCTIHHLSAYEWWKRYLLFFVLFVPIM